MMDNSTSNTSAGLGHPAKRRLNAILAWPADRLTIGVAPIFDIYGE